MVKSVDILTDVIDDIASTLDGSGYPDEGINDPHEEVFHHDGEHTVLNDPIPPSVGDHEEIYWPLDSTFYPGTASVVDSNGNHITYEQGGHEVMKLHYKDWRVLLVSNANFPSTQLHSNEQATVS